MSRKFHLLLDFDHVWRALAAWPSGWRRIECYLACRPDVHLTFVTGRSLGEALAELSERGDLFPDSWICDGGRSLHHLQSDGAYEADQAFERGLDLLSHESLGRGREEAVQPSLAALYLGAKGWTPRPRIAVGDLAWNGDLMRIADRTVRVNSRIRNLETAVLAGIREALEPSLHQEQASRTERERIGRPHTTPKALAIPL